MTISKQNKIHQRKKEDGEKVNAEDVKRGSYRKKMPNDMVHNE